MKHTLLFLLSVILLVGCHSNESGYTGENEALVANLSAVYQQTRNDNKEKRFDEARVSLEKALKSLPNSVVPDDSLLKYTRLVLSEYKSTALGSREFQQALRYLTTLQVPIIRNDCLYEFLAIRAHLHQMAGENTQAIALADSFAALPTPEDKGRIIQNSEMVGSAYFYSGNNIKKAIEQLENAVNTYRQGIQSPYMGRIFSRLAYYYRENNDYQKAAETNQAAIEFYETDTLPQQKNGLIMAYGEQANLFLALNMYDRAMELNRLACQHSVRQDSFGLSDLYRFKSEIFLKSGQNDSVVHYLRRAYEVSKALGNFKGAAYNHMALAQAYLTMPDSVQRALEITQALCADSVRMPSFFRLNLKMNLGQALLQNGQPEKGMRLMEEVERGYLHLGMEDMRSESIKKLMQAYLDQGMKDKFFHQYPYYQSVIDSMEHDNEIRALASANIRFETQKKEQQNQLLNAEIKVKNSRMQTLVVLGCTLLIGGCCIGGWLLSRQHALKLRLQLREKEKQLSEHQLREQSERLQQLITSRQELNNHNEELLRQLAEIQSTHEKTCDLDRVMESLQPRLLTNEEEEQFRTAFASLHPTVLHQLRSICPRATRSDELLCMLILLKQTNEEIARTLGISRASVLQNRYRLRTKLSLPEGCDLDQEVRNRLLPI